MVYILFSFFLLLANSKRKIKTTRVIWGFMCFVICFLMMSGLLEVGQANYNTLET
jgi:amino acid permease